MSEIPLNSFYVLNEASGGETISEDSPATSSPYEAVYKRDNLLREYFLVQDYLSPEDAARALDSLYEMYVPLEPLIPFETIGLPSSRLAEKIKFISAQDGMVGLFGGQCIFRFSAEENVSTHLSRRVVDTQGYEGLTIVSDTEITPLLRLIAAKTKRQERSVADLRNVTKYVASAALGFIGQKSKFTYAAEMAAGAANDALRAFGTFSFPPNFLEIDRSEKEKDRIDNSMPRKPYIRPLSELQMEELYPDEKNKLYRKTPTHIYVPDVVKRMLQTVPSPKTFLLQNLDAFSQLAISEKRRAELLRNDSVPEFLVAGANRTTAIEQYAQQSRQALDVLLTQHYVASHRPTFDQRHKTIVADQELVNILIRDLRYTKVAKTLYPEYFSTIIDLSASWLASAEADSKAVFRIKQIILIHSQMVKKQHSLNTIEGVNAMLNALQAHAPRRLVSKELRQQIADEWSQKLGIDMKKTDLKRML